MLQKYFTPRLMTTDHFASFEIVFIRQFMTSCYSSIIAFLYLVSSFSDNGYGVFSDGSNKGLEGTAPFSLPLLFPHILLFRVPPFPSPFLPFFPKAKLFRWFFFVEPKCSPKPRNPAPSVLRYFLSKFAVFENKILSDADTWERICCSCDCEFGTVINVFAYTATGYVSQSVHLYSESESRKKRLNGGREQVRLQCTCARRRSVTALMLVVQAADCSIDNETSLTRRSQDAGNQ